MRLLLLSILFSFSLIPAYTQCVFGFEHINSFSDSAVVIKKYGFPLNTEFRFVHYLDMSNDTIVTSTTSQLNDTLFFDSQADTIGSFYLTAISSANDTLGFFKSESAYGYPTNLALVNYIPPSTLLSLDGEIEFYTDSIDGVQSGFSLNGGANIAKAFDSLTAGIIEGVYQDGPFQVWSFNFIMGNPEDWVNVNTGAMTCPVGVTLASEAGICDGEAFISEVQNGNSPYTYDWNGTGVFVSDTTISGLCVGNQFVIIKDSSDLLKTCAFAMGSIDNGYFPPIQTSDTTIHTYTEYCMDPSVDSISLIGSEIIDSLSFSVIWSFYDGSVLMDQLLDTVRLNTIDSTFNSIELHLHLTCNNDTLKSTTSVYSTYGYISLPFTETGVLSLNEWNKEVAFNVYPNPVSNLLNIDIKVSELEKIIITNDLGQEVNAYVNLNDSHLTIDFSNVSKGNYIVTAIMKDKTIYSKKVIKN